MDIPETRKVVPEADQLPFQAKEAINVLRGNIQLSGFDLKVIAVTSALAHEGKSSIAFRLAKSMAGLKKRTVYLDCDIQNAYSGESNENDQVALSNGFPILPPGDTKIGWSGGIAKMEITPRWWKL